MKESRVARVAGMTNARMIARPFDELVRLAFVGGKPKRVERVRALPTFVPSHPLNGLGRLHVRILALLAKRSLTSRQLSLKLGHAYDATAATMSALSRDGIVVVEGEARGPTGQRCRVYGLKAQ